MKIDLIFAQLVDLMEQILFFSIGNFPLIIAWLVLGSLFFTLRFGLIGIRGFKHALDIAQGKYDTGEGLGEVSAFQALATALSGTVGLGNIAGVAIAIHTGGVGAVFWMSLIAFGGMANKFIECTLGQQYRQINADGTISGGPMHYLSQGLSELGFASLGKFLAILFSLCCIGASFGGGNMFQVNQSWAAVIVLFPDWANYNRLFGIIVAVLVGLIIIGGINRIGTVASKLAPLMIGIYLIACLWVIGLKITEIPQAIQTILQQAFSTQAVEDLFGNNYVFIYKSLFLIGIFVGAIAEVGSVVDFSDMMLLAMALPNIFGCLLLSNQVAKNLSNYWLKLSLLAIERQKN